MWLDARNITTRRPSEKLDHRRLGPYEVVESVGPNAVRLRLPDSVRLHTVFHVSLLEHAASDPLPGQRRRRPPAVIVDGEEKWVVERVLDSHLFYRKLQYLVKWMGDDTPTWQPVGNMENAMDAVRDFHRLNPDVAALTSIEGGTFSLKG